MPPGPLHAAGGAGHIILGAVGQNFQLLLQCEHPSFLPQTAALPAGLPALPGFTGRTAPAGTSKQVQKTKPPAPVRKQPSLPWAENRMIYFPAAPAHPCHTVRRGPIISGERTAAGRSQSVLSPGHIGSFPCLSLLWDTTPGIINTRAEALAAVPHHLVFVSTTLPAIYR